MRRMRRGTKEDHHGVGSGSASTAATPNDEEVDGNENGHAGGGEDGSHGEAGIWIGIDLGTSNSACAVWDSTRGGPKWMRLPTVAAAEEGGKVGRIMPSAVRFVTDVGPDDEENGGDDDNGGGVGGGDDSHRHRQPQPQRRPPLVGAPALVRPNDDDRSSLLLSVKRLLGKRYADLDPGWIQSLDYDVVRGGGPVTAGGGGNDGNSIQIVARTSRPHRAVTTTPQAVLAHELRALRVASQSYLDRHRRKKGLQVPGAAAAGPPLAGPAPSRDGGARRTNDEVRNVIVGVPAHFSQRHVRLVEGACREAGFGGHVGTFLESTAAAMAYGITLQERADGPDGVSHNHTIMVIDMGGGTTDITIAARKSLGGTQDGCTAPDAAAVESESSPSSQSSSSSYQVLVTKGDERLGGDDIDRSILQYCLHEGSKGDDGGGGDSDGGTLETTDMQNLLAACRQAKEALCRSDNPSVSEAITVRRRKGRRHEVVITPSVFQSILEPWLERAKGLIQKALDLLDGVPSTSGPIATNIAIDEVVLVGGTTRVPAIRQMIRGVFPNIELSTSLDPMSSVAQGLAIQAAIVSNCVPMHQLKSALMLDCVPHAIGVLLSKGSNGNDEDDGEMDRNGDGVAFVEIIPRNTPLPARGSATFVLADKHQPGVTIRAVEEIGDAGPHNRNTTTSSRKSIPIYEPIRRDDFTFLLRRLTPDELSGMTSRSIQVGMMVGTDGRFVVSIFDERDPEQVRKKQRYERSRGNGNETSTLEAVGELGYIKDMMFSEPGATAEQFMLIMMLIGVVVLYIGVRVAFTDPTEDGPTIL